VTFGHNILSLPSFISSIEHLIVWRLGDLSHGHILVFQLATKMGYRSSTIVDINGPWLQLYMGCMSFKTLLEAGLYLNVNIIRVSLGSMRAFNHCYCLKLTTEWSNKNWAASSSHLCAVCVYTHTHTHTERNTCCKSADRKIKQSLQLLQMRALLKLYACSERYKLKCV
jgi:hypothetical protein